MLGMALALLAVRLALPPVLEAAINRRLEKIPEYSGRVADIDLHLWRGAYQLSGIRIEKTTGGIRQPFFSARQIDFSLAWRDLLRGRIVGDFILENAELTLINASTGAESQKEADGRWREALKDIFPIEITRLEISDSTVRFIDRAADPAVDIALRALVVVAEGLRNRPTDTRQDLPARIELSARTIGDGDLRMSGGWDALAERPRFNLNLELTGVNLPALNDFLLAYGNVDVSRGEFQLFLEVAAEDGRYQGYLKPFFENLDFTNVEDQNKNLGQRLWERLVSALSTLVKNKPRDQVATRVPFSGEFGEADVGMVAAVGNLLRHGFGRALSERLAGEILAPGEGGALRPDPNGAVVSGNPAKAQTGAQAGIKGRGDAGPVADEAFDEASRRGKRP